MTVPFLDLNAAVHELRDQFDAAYHRVMDSGCFLFGPELEKFEQAFASYCRTQHCIGVANGFDAIKLILLGYDIGPGDEVIVPAHTFIATWLAVTSTGATPVPVDIDEQTYNIDPTLIPPAITSKTRAIIPVHLYGQPADMEGVRSAITPYQGIKIIEDAAQAHGARYNNQMVGSLGNAAAFSFYPGKNLGAFGDGGAIVSNDDILIKRIRSIANYGSVVKYEHQDLGINSRLDALQAAFLSIRLSVLDEWNQRRSQIANHYNSQLTNTRLILPKVPAGFKSTWHLFIVRTERREALLAYLQKQGITALIHYPKAPHQQKAYQKTHGHLTLPRSERVAASVLSLPIGPHLHQSQQDAVIQAILDWEKKS